MLKFLEIVAIVFVVIPAVSWWLHVYHTVVMIKRAVDEHYNKEE